MTLSEMLSGAGASAMVEAVEIGKDMLKDDFYSACVKKLLKNGFWADITDKNGNVYKITVKKKSKNETIISRR